MATLYLDLLGGNDSNDGTSFANRVKTITSGITAARTAPGDVIRLMKSADPTSMGQNATFTKGSKTVTLASAVTATIDNCESAWTASANVTTSTSSSNVKEGTNSATIAPAGAFTTGMMAYKAISATDFSGYQQISFWIRSSIATHVASDLTIRLCSDNAGAVTVDTLNLPAIPTSNVFQAVVINKGSALGASIQSIAIDVNTDRGACTLTIDNIQACKAVSSNDSLTIHSLIGKNVDGDGWWPIKSISGTTVILDESIAATPSVGRGYAGATATTTAYKREPIVLPTLAAQTIQESGSLGNVSLYSGGWDTTNMTSQTGETWITFQNGQTGMSTGARSFISFEKISQVRGSGFALANQDLTLTACHVVASSNTSGGFNIAQGCTGLTFTDCMSYANLTYGWSGYGGGGSESATWGGRNIYSNCRAHSNGYSGFGNQNGPGNIYKLCYALNNAIYGWAVRGGVKLLTCTTADNGTSGLGPPDPSAGSAYNQTGDIIAYSCTFSETTEFTVQNGSSIKLISMNHEASGTHKVITDYGTIITDTSVRHSAVGSAWKFSPTNAARTANYPLGHPIGRVACIANKQVTLKYWFRRTNTGISAQLMVRGGQALGVASDVTASMSVSADTWEQLSVSFTPTENCVIEVEALVWGGTTFSAYVHENLTFQG